MKIIVSEKQKEKRQRKSNLWEVTKQISICIVEVPGQKRKGQRIFEIIIPENFPNLMKHININIKEAQQFPSKMNSKRSTPRHIINFQRENLESSRTEVTDYTQRILNKIISTLLIRNFRGQNAMGQYTQNARRKKNCQSKISQNYPSRVREELRRS